MPILLSDLTKMKTSELAACLREILLEHFGDDADEALEICDEIEQRAFKAESVYRDYQA